jgi:hypothetical protein
MCPRAAPGSDRAPGIPLAATASMFPGVRVRSVTGTFAAAARFEWIRALMTRP